MKQQFVKSVRWLRESRGLPLVALAVLGMVTIMPGWVSAQSETTTTFTSPLPGGHHGEHGGPNDEIRELLDSIVDRDEILADVLGITVEELAAAKEAGTSIDELVANAGLDKETVRTEIKEAITAAVEQAVTDGTITQEQADLILTPPAPPQQPGQGHGHHGPGDGEHDPQTTTTPTLIATAPADGSATATPEATATAEATTAGTAATSTSASSDRPRPPHDHQAPPQNSDSNTTTSSSDSSTSTTSSESTTTASDTTSSTSDSAATNDQQASNEQPANDRPDHGGHQRPGR